MFFGNLPADVVKRCADSALQLPALIEDPPGRFEKRPVQFELFPDPRVPLLCRGLSILSLNGFVVAPPDCNDQ